MKLTIELVPKSSWQQNVRSALPKSEWDRIRKETYRNAGYRCEICGGVGESHPVECHEIWEYDDERNIQRLSGFIALCPDCHRCKHIGLATIQGFREEARLHLAKVNEVSLDKVDDIILSAFEKWNERSQHEWTVDLSIILD